MNQVKNQPQIIITQSPKSMGIAILLSVLFGPLGMLYSTIKGGIIMMVVSLIIGILTLGLGLLITFPIGVIWAAIAVNTHNKKLMAGIV